MTGNLDCGWVDDGLGWRGGVGSGRGGGGRINTRGDEADDCDGRINRRGVRVEIPNGSLPTSGANEGRCVCGSDGNGLPLTAGSLRVVGGFFADPIVAIDEPQRGRS